MADGKWWHLYHNGAVAQSNFHPALMTLEFPREDIGCDIMEARAEGGLASLVVSVLEGV